MPRFIGPAVVTAVLLTLVPPVLARSGIGHAPGRAAERVEWRPPMRLPFGIDSEITPAQRVRPAVCFAPGTTEEVIRSYAGGGDESGTASAQFNLYSRWSATATDGCCLSQGDPTTITFSFVPDGTPIGGFADEPASPSDVQAFLNSIYGSPSIWIPIFKQVFDRWAALTGTRYVYEPNDDGARFPNSGGLLGVRGDVRIAGHRINGDYGILAYNFYPDSGDMVLDTADSFFRNTALSSLRLRNVLAHEHGHGLGIDHVCPLSKTKLMEPIATLEFDGPQHDDVLAGNRGYGDDFEDNDSAAEASDLGLLGDEPIAVKGLGIDGGDDVDVFRFTVAAGRAVSAAIVPVGATYLQGPQNPNGSCSAGQSFDSTAIDDLKLEVLAPDGKTVLATANATPAGAAEELSKLGLPNGAGPYYVRVSAASGQDVQLYDLDLVAEDAGPPAETLFEDDFESGDFGAWLESRTDGGDLAVRPEAALHGDMGVEALVNDGNSLVLIDGSPSAEPRYRARFRFDPSGFTPGKASDRTQIFRVLSEAPTSRPVVILVLRVGAKGPELMARTLLDGGSLRSSGFVALADGPQSIEVDWKKSSAPGADDGSLKVWLDGEPKIDLGGLDADRRSVDAVRLGVMQVRPGASGRLLFDDFVSRRSTYIGP